MLKKKTNWKKRSHQFFVEKQKRRAKKILRLKRRHRSYNYKTTYSNSPKISLTKEELLAREFPGFRHVRAPQNFSIINNETQTLKFLQELKDCLNKRQKTLVRLDNVKHLSTDAILVLLSNMVHFQVEGVGFNGTKPTIPHIRQKLEGSSIICME